MEMLVDRFDRGGTSKEDAHAITHDIFAIENLTYPNRRFGVVKGDNDAAEGFERCP